jgi:hypothetical protein
MQSACQLRVAYRLRRREVKHSARLAAGEGEPLRLQGTKKNTKEEKRVAVSFDRCRRSEQFICTPLGEQRSLGLLVLPFVPSCLGVSFSQPPSQRHNSTPRIRRESRQLGPKFGPYCLFRRLHVAQTAQGVGQSRDVHPASEGLHLLGVEFLRLLLRRVDRRRQQVFQ